MNQASLYSKYNGLQKNDANFVIDNFFQLIQWKKNENILDVGCGDGDVIFELLLPKLPINFNKFIATDISEEMVQFAKKKCDHPKIEFQHLDISAIEYNPEFHENFDHIFSFYCLHWVLDQRQAFRNMYEMLKPGGTIFITFLASNPIYDIYENMAKSNKWAIFMRNFQKYISPYHHSTNPEKQLADLLKKQGYTSHLCKVVNRCYTFPSFEILAKSVAAVNPFIKKIPENEIESYIDDYLKEVRKLDSITIETCNNNNNNDEKISVPYRLFIALASKPL